MSVSLWNLAIFFVFSMLHYGIKILADEMKPVMDGNNLPRRENVLMLVAHPDDEVLFGSRDLILSNTTVVCMTNLNDKKRRGEFEDAMRIVNVKNIMLDFPDLQFSPWKYNESFIILEELVRKLVIASAFDVIVSHGTSGEYGHCHHMQLSKWSRKLSQDFNIPYKSFCDRYSPENMKNDDFANTRHEIMRMHKSQRSWRKKFDYEICANTDPDARKNHKHWNQNCYFL